MYFTFSNFPFKCGLLPYLIQVLFCFCSHSSSSSNSSSKSEPTEVTPNTLINTFPRAPGTSDSIRLKCREMISNALQTGGNPVIIIWTTHFRPSICCYCGWLRLNLFKYFSTFFSDLFSFFSFPDDYIAIGADCDELGAQIEENILYIDWKMCLKQMFVLLHIVMRFWMSLCFKLLL